MANEAATAMNNTVASTDPTMARTLKKKIHLLLLFAASFKHPFGKEMRKRINEGDSDVQADVTCRKACDGQKNPGEENHKTVFCEC